MSMRVTESYMANAIVRDTNRSLATMLRLQRMASSLHRVNSYSDDPIAVGAIQRYQSQLGTNEQYRRNVDQARVFLDSTDTALQDIQDVLSEARVLALQESSGTASLESNRLAGEQTVENLIGRMLDIMNLQVEGNYIFAGHETRTEPFVRNGEVVQYQGDAEEIRVQVGSRVMVPANIPGEAFRGSGTAVLGGWREIAPNLNLGHDLDLLNFGGGWQPGRFIVTTGDGDQHSIDLTGALTVGDVITQINAQSAGAVTASLNADGRSLQLAGDGPLTVLENGGTTAQSLGLMGTSDSNLLVGRDIRPSPTSATLLTSIPDLAGNLPLGRITVITGDTETEVDLSLAGTIGDLQSLIHAAVPELDLRIEGGGLTLVSGSARTFQVENADDTATATVLGLQGTGSPARLFGAFFDLKSALLAGDTEGIRGSIAEIEAVQDQVMAQLVKVGGRQSTLDWTERLLLQREEKLHADLSRERDADIAEVATGLSKAQSAYEATLLVTSRLFEVNLMQYLR